MKTIVRTKAVLGLAGLAGAVGISLLAFGAFAQTPATPTSTAIKPLDVARISPSGKLQKPADLDNWVFLGTSLGMGYNPGSFNAANPGQFQVVLMEPSAYRHFVANGKYAPGSMFLLSFYDADTRKRSVSQNGFTQAELTNYEIHVIEDAQDAARHTFYTFGANSTEGTRLPPGNGCVSCHLKHGAFDGTFAQFYPPIRPLIPKADLERALNNHDIR